MGPEWTESRLSMSGAAGPSRRGFTLVEVLVAMTVASVGLLAIFAALRLAGSTADMVRNQQQAQLLAEVHMTEPAGGAGQGVRRAERQAGAV